MVRDQGFPWYWLSLVWIVLVLWAGACTPKSKPAGSPENPTPTNSLIEISLFPVLPAVEQPELPLTGIELSAFNKSGGLHLAVNLGTYWVRRNMVLWVSVEPQEGKRNWEQLADLEAELINAAKYHLQVILVVRGTPVWAQAVPGSQCGPIKPEKLTAFSRFLHDLVKRYSQPPYQVRYWELGNEPDVDPSLIAGDSHFGCWGQADDMDYGGGAYAEMLKQAYPQIKAAAPQAQVLIGGLLLDCNPNDPPPDRTCQPARYLEGILKNGGGEYFDGVSFHAYDYYLGVYQYGNANWKSAYNTSGPVLVAKARFLRSMLAAYGYTDKYMLNSEAGILCSASGNEPECLEEGYQLTKAYYLAIANAAAAAESLRANVWYSLFGWRGSGLVNTDSQPLPAYEAMRFSSSMLNGAAYVRSLEISPVIQGYEFTRAARRLWLIWATDTSEHTLQLPAVPEELFDVLGTRLEPTQIVKVSPAPVYVIFPVER